MAARSAAVVVAVLALSQEPGGVQVSVVRFYRSANALTLVDAFCRVPVSAVSALSSGGATAGAAYGVSVVVHDSAGTELTSQTWSQTVPRSLLGVSGASLVEHFAFAARGRGRCDAGAPRPRRTAPRGVPAGSYGDGGRTRVGPERRVRDGGVRHRGGDRGCGAGGPTGGPVREPGGVAARQLVRAAAVPDVGGRAGDLFLAHGGWEAKLPAEVLGQARPHARHPAQRGGGALLRRDHGGEPPLPRGRGRRDPGMANGSRADLHPVWVARRSAQPAPGRQHGAVRGMEIHEDAGAQVCLLRCDAVRELRAHLDGRAPGA